MSLRLQIHQLLLLYSILCLYPVLCDGAEPVGGPGGGKAMLRWVPQPDGRGTVDIMISCCFTIFLCSWYCVCVNVSAEDDTLWDSIRDKFSICLLCVLGPEFVLYISMAQFHSASQSVDLFREIGHPQWTITHGFFADMGGFVLNSPDFVSFPVDAKQLHYLIRKGYVSFPAVTEAEIMDKNKVNFIARLVALGQVLWFTANCIARIIQHIGLTAAELTTLSFIFCTMITSYYWRHKPADVERPMPLHTDTKIADILRAESEDAARLPYRNTPLDFVSRREWTVSRHWQYWRRILAEIGVEALFFRPRITRPLTRIPDDMFRLISSPMTFLSWGLMTLMYSAIFLVGWNFHFPTPTERLLWRFSASLLMAVSSCAVIGIWFIEFTLPDLKKRRAEVDPERVELEQPAPPQSNKSRLERLRSFGTKGDIALRVELKELIPFTVLAALYSICRYYIILEDCICVRSQPPHIYQTVKWSSFLPHF